MTRDVDDASTVVAEDDEDEQQLNVTVGTTNRAAMIWLAWLVRKVRQVCDGGGADLGE